MKEKIRECTEVEREDSMGLSLIVQIMLNHHPENFKNYLSSIIKQIINFYWDKDLHSC